MTTSNEPLGVRIYPGAEEVLDHRWAVTDPFNNFILKFFPARTSEWVHYIDDSVVSAMVQTFYPASYEESWIRRMEACCSARDLTQRRVSWRYRNNRLSLGKFAMPPEEELGQARKFTLDAIKNHRLPEELVSRVFTTEFQIFYDLDDQSQKEPDNLILSNRYQNQAELLCILFDLTVKGQNTPCDLDFYAIANKYPQIKSFVEKSYPRLKKLLAGRSYLDNVS